MSSISKTFVIDHERKGLGFQWLRRWSTLERMMVEEVADEAEAD